MSSILLEKKHRNYFVFIFLIIILVSMLDEDTFETQYGVILYAFWGALFIFAQETKELNETTNHLSTTEEPQV
jgi:hypothetical protein